MLSVLVVHCLFSLLHVCVITSLRVKSCYLLNVNCYICLSPCHTFTTDVLSFVMFTCSMSWMFLTCAIHITNILLLTCYICLYSPCNMPVFFLSCDICLSVLHVCSTHTELTYTTLTHTTYIVCYPPCIVWSLLLHNKNGSLVFHMHTR